ncbi:sortase [Nocardioides sp. Arc9.136]|uniref:sortase domain-containing protein n=1 Tax=Nocardioides sp. Arc9.136 TaxID=2996826 RepID=UPI0026663089|nr:sortase [Nocardioides sp. Arc9.136]WKN50568.1 sortase [Nocardioides sp. Arc9.136]
MAASRSAALVGALLLGTGLLQACSGTATPAGAPASRSPSSAPAATAAPSPSTSPTTSPSMSPTTSPSASATSEPPAGDGRPRRSLLSVPAIGLRDLPVLPYRGWTDDAPGTAIQDGGVAASPHGPRGGTGPGGIGNYQVTAHRLSSTRAFERLPELERGDVLHVVAGGVRHTYRVTTTRRTSFRSPASLRAQRAAVPGRPGAVPTRAMITLSTCATIEDHAVGNYWSDRFDNPEHRIDKIGVLVRSTPV